MLASKTIITFFFLDNECMACISILIYTVWNLLPGYYNDNTTYGGIMVTFSRKLLSKVCIGFSFWPKGGSPTIWMCWTIENIEQQSILNHFASLVIKFYNIFFSCLHFMSCVCVISSYTYLVVYAFDIKSLSPAFDI